MTKYMLLLLLTFSQFALGQKTLKIDAGGRLDGAQAKELLKKRKYQLVSGFDTVSKKPLLVYALYMQKGKFGIIDNTGKEITPAVYDKIDGLDKYDNSLNGFGRYYIITKGGLKGLISNTGKEMFSPKYKSLYREVTDSVYVVTDEGSEVFLNIHGKVIAYKEVDRWAAQSKGAKPRQVVTPDAANRLYHIKYNYPDEAEYTIPNLGTIVMHLASRFVVFSNKEKMQGVYDNKKAALIIPFEYKSIEPLVNNGFKLGKGSLYGMADSTGTVVVPVKYPYIAYYGKAYGVLLDKKYALFSLDYKQVTDFKFDMLMGSRPSGVIVAANGKYGIINAEGKEVIPPVYDMLYGDHSMQGEGPLYFKTDGKYGLITDEGTIVLPAEYDELLSECSVSGEAYSLHAEMMMICNTDNLYYYFKKGGKYGILSTDYKVIVPAEYENMLEAMTKWLVYVKKDGKWGLLNVRTNRLIIPCEHNQGIKFEWSYYFSAQKDRKYGLYDKQGKLVVPFGDKRFLTHHTFNGLLSISEIDGVSYYVDGYGNKIIYGEGVTFRPPGDMH